jgi:hypothetical protein
MPPTRRRTNLLLYLRQHGEVATVLVVGLVLIFPGFFLWPYYQRVGPTLISIGTSLIAAALVTYLNPTNREIFQKFLSLGISDVYPARRDVEDRDWVKWIRAARTQCTVLGISNSNWCDDPDFKTAVTELVSRDVAVKFFFLNPKSPAAELRTEEEKSEISRDTIQTIRSSIKLMWDLKSELQEDRRDNFKLFVYNATPSFGATCVDTLMIATHYLAGLPNVTSPCVLIRPVASSEGREDLYGVYDRNLRNIEKHHANEITQNNIADYVPTEPAANV